jgi:hypothetical protein
MSDFAQYGPTTELQPSPVAKGYLGRNAANNGWRETLPENLLSDAAAAVSVNSQLITNVATPTPGTSNAATAAYAESVGVNSVNTSAYLLVDSAFTTGLSQPASMPDSDFTSLSPNGSVAGVGIAGIVSATFTSTAAETGTSSGQGGLGSVASATQPYNTTDFPGQHGITVTMRQQNGSPITVSDMNSTIPAPDNGQPVFAFLSYRSDLGANAHWRLWYYYQSVSSGLYTPFTPNLSVTNAAIYVPSVTTLGSRPVASGLTGVSSTAAVAGVVFGFTSDVADVGTTDYAGSTGRVSDAGHVHEHGYIPNTYASGGNPAHGLASATEPGFMTAAQYTTVNALPASSASSATQVIAGSGLTGGGALTGNVTLNVGANVDGSITVNATNIQVGVLATDAQHGARGGGTQHSAATESVNGFMSSTDKTKVDGLPTTFNVTQTTTNATPVAVSVYTPASGEMAALSFTVAAFNSAGPTGAWFRVSAGFRNTGGTTTQVGNAKIEAQSWDTALAGIGVDVSVTSPAVNVVVTGLAATSIAWRIQGIVVLAP